MIQAGSNADIREAIMSEGRAAASSNRGAGSSAQRSVSRLSAWSESRAEWCQHLTWHSVIRVLCSHTGLMLLLVSYDIIGAVIFYYIEGPNEQKERKQLESGREQIIADMWDISMNSSLQQFEATAMEILTMYEQDLHKEFANGITLLTDPKWDFMGSMFFCATVFSTIGYGHIAPKTTLGRSLTIGYALIGIPIFLMVITDFGGLFAKVFRRLWFKLMRSIKKKAKKKDSRGNCDEHDGPNSVAPHIPDETAGQAGTSGGATAPTTHGYDNNPPEPAQAGTEMPSSEIGCKSNGVKLLNYTPMIDEEEETVNIGSRTADNDDAMEEIPSSENNKQVPPAPDTHDVGDSGAKPHSNSDDMPIVIPLITMFCFMALGALILPLWEEQWSHFEAFYFCFITLTTIGFGDVVPEDQGYLLLLFIFILFGMAWMTMCMSMAQRQIWTKVNTFGNKFQIDKWVWQTEGKTLHFFHKHYNLQIQKKQQMSENP